MKRGSLNLCFLNIHTPAFLRSSRPRGSCRHPLIVVMESTHFRESDDRSLFRRLCRAGVRAIHGERQMRPPAMVVVRIAGQEAPEVALAENHHLIQALPPDAPDHPLGIGILPRTPRRGQDLIDAQVRHVALKPRAIHGIAIAKQVLGRGLPGFPGRCVGGPSLGDLPSRRPRPRGPGRVGPSPGRLTCHSWQPITECG